MAGVAEAVVVLSVFGFLGAFLCFGFFLALVSSALASVFAMSEDLAASAFAGAAGVVVLAVSAAGLAGAVAGWASTENDAEANSTAMVADSFFIFVIIPRVVWLDRSINASTALGSASSPH